MSLRKWWKRSREKADATKRSLALNDDQQLITEKVPELAGMTDVQGMAHTLKQIEEWNQSCSPSEAAEFAGRLMASNASWEAENMTMPYWGNLWVLRTYQQELSQGEASSSRL